MLKRAIKKWFIKDDHEDWESKYIKLRQKHDKLCEYVLGLAEDRSDVYTNMIMSIEQQRDFDKEFIEDLKNHGKNISKLDL